MGPHYSPFEDYFGDCTIVHEYRISPATGSDDAIALAPDVVARKHSEQRGDEASAEAAPQRPSLWRQILGRARLLFTLNSGNSGKRPTRSINEVVAAARDTPYSLTERAYAIDILERVHAIGRGGRTSDVEDAVRKMMLTEADKELHINVCSIIREAAPEYMEPVGRIISEVMSNLPPSRVCVVLAITACPLPFATAERLFIDIQDEQARKGRQVSPDCKFLTSVADPDDKQHAFALLRKSGLSVSEVETADVSLFRVRGTRGTSCKYYAVSSRRRVHFSS